MLQLGFKGELKGDYKGISFKIVCKEKKINIYFNSLKELSSLFKSLTGNVKAEMSSLQTAAQFLSKEFEITLYGEDRPIVKVGKHAKSDPITAMLGLENVELLVSDFLGPLFEKS